MFLWLRIAGKLSALRLGPRGGTGLRLFAGESSGGMNDNNKGDAARFGGHGNQYLVASGFSIVGILRPQYLVPAESVPTLASLILAMYAAARTIPLALFALWAIYKQATPALVLLGALAGAMQLLDAGIGLFEHDLGKCGGPLFIAVLQFFVVYAIQRSRREPSAGRLSP